MLVNGIRNTEHKKIETFEWKKFDTTFTVQNKSGKVY